MQSTWLWRLLATSGACTLLVVQARNDGDGDCATNAVLLCACFPEMSVCEIETAMCCIRCAKHACSTSLGRSLSTVWNSYY